MNTMNESEQQNMPYTIRIVGSVAIVQSESVILVDTASANDLLAIFGDFSEYTSKPLHDFIYECNRGKSIFFVGAEADAVARLSV